MWKSHRKSLWLLLLIGLTSTAAQATDPRLWDTTGVAIRQGHEIDWQRSAEMDEGGNVVCAWSDARSGERQIYAQKVDPAGNKLWDAQGLQIAPYPGSQEDPALIPTGDGNYMIVWKDCRLETTYGDLYGQCVSSDGQILWDSSGVLLSPADLDFPAEIRLVADSTGGAIIFWREYPGTGWHDVYAIRILANGSVAPYWPAAGLAVAQAPYDQAQITACSDGSGGAIVAWRDERNQLTTQSDIYIQRVTPEGNLAWTPPGVIVCDALEDQNYPKICPNGSGGAYVVWEDERRDYEGDLYFQIVSSSGSLLLPEPQGRPLIAPPQAQERPQIVADGSGNAIIAWRDLRNDPLTNQFGDIYAQKVNSGGDLLWQSDGVCVCIEPADQREVRLDADEAGGAIVVWEDCRNDPIQDWYSDIYAQKINADGSMAWTTNGALVCDAPYMQLDPLVKATSTSSFMAWEDYRSGSRGIWYQKLNASGIPQLAANGDTLIWGISGDARYPVLVQGDQSQVFIFYEDWRDGFAGASAYMQMVDQQGNVLLEPNGRPICPDPVFTSYKPQGDLDACSDGSGGAIAVWLDSRDSNPVTQIYAQRINADGELAWGNAGVPVSSSSLEPPWDPKIVEDGSGGGILAWSEASASYDYDLYAARLSHEGDLVWSDSVAAVLGEDETVQDLAGDGSGGVYIAYRGAQWPEYNIYAQHLDASGNLLWGDGVPVCTEIGIQSNCRIASLGANGAIFVWEDGRDEATWGKDLFAQKLNWAGTLSWQAGGIPVCQYAGDQEMGDLSQDGDGNLVVVWTDLRSATCDLYAQKMTSDGQMLFTPGGIPVCNAPGYQGYPCILSDNGGGNYVLWTDLRDGPNEEDVYGLHLDGQGLPYASWSANGNLACSNPYDQQQPVAIGDFANGAIVVWADERPSDEFGQVTNLYAQRMNDLSLSAPPVPRNEPLYPEPMLLAGPNPTNPLTVIRCLLPQPGFMELSIFDVSGRLVEKLATGTHAAGTYAFTWDARDKASGVYIVRLKTPLADKSTKLVMIK